MAAVLAAAVAIANSAPRAGASTQQWVDLPDSTTMSMQARLREIDEALAERGPK